MQSEIDVCRTENSSVSAFCTEKMKPLAEIRNMLEKDKLRKLAISQALITIIPLFATPFYRESIEQYQPAHTRGMVLLCNVGYLTINLFQRNAIPGHVTL